MKAEQLRESLSLKKNVSFRESRTAIERKDYRERVHDFLAIKCRLTAGDVYFVAV